MKGMGAPPTSPTNIGKTTRTSHRNWRSPTNPTTTSMSFWREKPICHFVQSLPGLWLKAPGRLALKMAPANGIPSKNPHVYIYIYTYPYSCDWPKGCLCWLNCKDVGIYCSCRKGHRAILVADNPIPETATFKATS